MYSQRSFEHVSTACCAQRVPSVRVCVCTADERYPMRASYLFDLLVLYFPFDLIVN